MEIIRGFKDKAKLLSECEELGLPVSLQDEADSLELIYSLAKTNGWTYSGDGSANDKRIEDIIERIRTYVKNRKSGPN